MSKLPFMPMYWSDFFSKTRHLTRSQEYSYLLILAFMWDHDGTVEDDDHQLARIAKLPLAQWRKEAPFVRKFLTSEDGFLANSRLGDELKKALHVAEINRVRARLGGIAKSLKNNHVDLLEADSKRASSLLSTSTSTFKEKIYKKESQKSSSEKDPFPDDWRPSNASWERAKAKLNGRSESELEAFRDFHRAKGTAPADLEAAWVTWVRNDYNAPKPLNLSNAVYRPNSGRRFVSEQSAEGRALKGTPGLKAPVKNMETETWGWWL